MRVAVLASPDSWYAADLRRAAAHDFEITTAAFSGIASRWDGACLHVTAGSCDLGSLDAVLVRTMPPGSLEQVVFRMDALGRLEAAGTTVVNSPRSIEVAVDKYLTTARLATVGLNSPRTVVCQTAEEAISAFVELGGDVVVKPLFGGEGRGLLRVGDENLAWRTFQTLARLDAVLYLQEFVAHEGFDVRLMVIGNRVWGMRRINEQDWRTNVSRGARTEPWVVDNACAELALSAAGAVGASVAGVDVLLGRDGRRYVLEVNAVPGWRALCRTLNLDVARLVLEHIAESVKAK
ncbi:MAG: RimK family alpha-L-glutamate ligase [Pirellulaceae bacterium]